MQLLVVLAGFICMNALFAGGIYLVFRLGQLFSPSLMHDVAFVSLTGTTTLVGCLWLSKLATEFIVRKRPRG